MCFFYALSKDAQSLKNRYQLKLDFDFELAPELRESKYYVSGFDFSKMPVITNEKPDKLQGFSWGLIPSWVKTICSSAFLVSLKTFIAPIKLLDEECQPKFAPASSALNI